MYLKDIIPACTSQNSGWLFCRSVTLLIIFISGIHSDHIHHHCSFPAELLVSSLKSYEIFHPDFTHCETHSEFSPSQAVRTLFSYLASSILIITLYFPLQSFSTHSQTFLCPSYSSSFQPIFPFLTMTVSGETLSKTSPKSRHIASTAFALSTKPVTLSQEKMKLV